MLLHCILVVVPYCCIPNVALVALIHHFTAAILKKEYFDFFFVQESDHSETRTSVKTQ